MRESRGRDRGQTFVEILVSIVLLGTAVGGTLTALRATIVSSEVDEGQADAQTWLLAAEDALYRATYTPCATPVPPTDPTGGAATKAAYETAIGNAPRPAGWSTGTISITLLEFWQKVDGQERWEPICPPDGAARRTAQLVTIIVKSPSGDVGKSIELIKRD